MEPNSRINLTKLSSDNTTTATTRLSRLNQYHNASTVVGSNLLTNKYSSPTRSSTYHHHHHSNYTTTPREPKELRYSSPMPTGLSTVLNSTYKSSNYNPSPTHTNSYLNTNNSYHYYHHLHHYHENVYSDYLTDDYPYDSSEFYQDDENSDYCCSTHSYPYYSKIY